MNTRIRLTLLALAAGLALHLSAGRTMSLPEHSGSVLAAATATEAQLASPAGQRHGDGEVSVPAGVPASTATRTRRGGTWSPRTPQPPSPSTGHGGRYGHSPLSLHGCAASTPYSVALGQRRETSPFACHPASDYYIYALRHILR